MDKIKEVFARLFCKHEFGVVQKVNVYLEGKRLPVAKQYHLACKHCGEIRKRQIKP